MEGLVIMFGDIYRGRKVWLSGVTGFKGSWLAEWLLSLGAEVHGFALVPSEGSSLFEQCGLADRITWDPGDLRDAEAVRRSMLNFAPDFVLHLAAQPLVRLSYQSPVETYATNVMGTIHVLEALRSLAEPCAAVLVTTDKCYENRELLHNYSEEDPLGGFDPYSSSKAACEIAIASWRRSFFKDHPVRIASARAGNVIGGGDWAVDRIVPDCIRALTRGEQIELRNPFATRPWQHVLEPLSGYLWLAAVLFQPDLRAIPSVKIASAFNFGPESDSNRTVAELVSEVLLTWPGSWLDKSDVTAPHEAKLLQLSTAKAKALLNWAPVWSFPEAVRETVGWYRRNPSQAGPGSAHPYTLRQITTYCERAAAQQAVWAA